MKKVYDRERSELIAQNRIRLDGRVLDGSAIAHLPAPLIRYFHVSKYLGKPVMANADVLWSESELRLGPGRPWSRLRTRQFNSVDPLARIAHMRFVGMPVSGRDIYRDGRGEIKGKLFNLFTIIDGSGREVTQSALITVFCEFLMLPTYALQRYVQWEAVDEATVSARLEDHGVSVGGLFRFNEDGLFERFETDDRYFDHGRGGYSKVRFSAAVESYQHTSDLLIPQKVRICWHPESGDYEYFRGVIEDIRFNPTH